MHDRDVYEQVARLHAASIDQGFLSTLGQRFLALLYEAFDEAADATLVVEKRGEKVIGFVSGCMGMSSIYRRMLRHPLRLTAALAPSLWRPSRLRRILEILRYGQRSSTGEEVLPDAELTSIGVVSEWRGCGVAQDLYRKLAEAFSGAGLAAFRIVVGESLGRAHGFYRRMGAEPVADLELHPGQRSIVYVQRLPLTTQVGKIANIGK